MAPLLVTPKPKPQPRGKPDWVWRRLALFTTLGFIGWQLASLRFAPDTRVNDTLAFGYIAFGALLVITYTGLATAQDITAILATRSALPYSPQSSPESTQGEVDAPPEDK